MIQNHKTEIKTDTAGIWRGGVSVLVENTGSHPATVAGKTLEKQTSISFTAVDVGDHIQFAYDCSDPSNPTTLTITYGVREMRGAFISGDEAKRV